MRVSDLKYSLGCGFLFLTSVFCYGQSISAGAAFEYNTSIESPGFNLRSYYNLNENICFGPELTFTFPKTIRTTIYKEDIFIFEANINAHYIFELFEEKLGAYPLFGVNYSSEQIELTRFDNNTTETKSRNSFGFNIGAGFHVPLNKFQPFVEYHFITGELGESVVSLGLLYTFGNNNDE